MNRDELYRSYLIHAHARTHTGGSPLQQKQQQQHRYDPRVYAHIHYLYVRAYVSVVLNSD